MFNIVKPFLKHANIIFIIKVTLHSANKYDAIWLVMFIGVAWWVVEIKILCWYCDFNEGKGCGLMSSSIKLIFLHC